MTMRYQVTRTSLTRDAQDAMTGVTHTVVVRYQYRAAADIECRRLNILNEDDETFYFVTENKDIRGQ